MSEEKIEQEVEEVGKEVTTPVKDDGTESKTISELDRADQIAERQKRENDRREALLIREENLAARKVVGGTTGAGTQPGVSEKKELSDVEYVEEVMSGKHNDKE